MFSSQERRGFCRSQRLVNSKRSQNMNIFYIIGVVVVVAVVLSYLGLR